MARLVGIKGEETRKRILACSLRLFARSGYAAVSMREIAQSVGVGAGAIYNHFETKQHILMAVMEDHMRALLAAYHDRQTHHGPSDPRAELEDFVRFHISYHIALPDEVFLSYMELRALEPENFQIIEALRREYEALLKNILISGQQQKILYCDDLHVSTMAILAMLTGVNSWFSQKGRLTELQIEDRYVALVMRTVGVHEAEQNNQDSKLKTA